MKTVHVRLFFLIIFSSLIIEGNSQGLSIPEILQKVSKNHSTLSPGFVISGNGKHRNDSHLKNPNVLNEDDYKLDIEIQNDSVILFKRFYVTNEGRSSYSESLIVDDQLFSYNERKSGYYRIHPNDTQNQLFRLYSTDPSLLVAYLRKNIDLVRSVDELSNGEFKLTIKFESGEEWTLFITKEFLCKEISYEYFHYLYGDVRKNYSWKNYIEIDGAYFPATVIVEDKGFNVYEYNQELGLANSSQSPKLNSILGVANEQIFNERNIHADSIIFSSIAESIYDLKLPETNNRLLVAEFKDFLILLEGSYHSRNGDLILEWLRSRFPKKAVRYWSFSHCHTQYIGFARSMVANQTQIVTSADNQVFIQKLGASSFTLRPDNQERTKAEPQFENLANNTWNIKDSKNELVIHNINSDHTDNYLVFYFPNQKIMFVGDLLWVTEEGGPIGGRSVTFYNEVMDRLKLDIGTFYISWPLEYYHVKNKVRLNEVIIKNEN